MTDTTMTMADLVMAAWMEGWNAALDAMTTPPYDHGEEARAAYLKRADTLATLSTLPNYVVTEGGARIWVVRTMHPMKDPPKFIGIDQDHFIVIQSKDPREWESMENIISTIDEMQFKLRGGEVSEISPKDPDFN